MKPLYFNFATFVTKICANHCKCNLWRPILKIELKERNVRLIKPLIPQNLQLKKLFGRPCNMKKALEKMFNKVLAKKSEDAGNLETSESNRLFWNSVTKAQ